MTEERYHELLGRLLDGELSPADGVELAEALHADPQRRQDARQHLVLWELFSQLHAPERGAHSFELAWRTRLASETDATEFVDLTTRRLDGVPVAGPASDANDPESSLGGPSPASRRPGKGARARVVKVELKAWNWRHSLALAAGVALLFSLGVWYLGPTMGQPVLARVQGATAIIERGTESIPATPGKALQRGDTLRTETNATATIAFGVEHTQIHLGSGTELKVTSFASGKRFDLRMGRLEADVARQRPFAPLVVTTPNAAATVLGTRFTLTASVNRAQLDVEEGTVRLASLLDTNAGPAKVPAHFYAVVAPGVELAPMPQTGFVVSEIWTNFTGQFEASVDFLGQADTGTEWKRMESVSMELGRYGERVRGFLHPPSTGDYVISLSGGGAAKFLLSTNEDPLAKTQIAFVNTRQSDRWVELSRHSSAVPLVAGRIYYFEIVHDSHTGAQPLRVEWRMAGRGDEVIPGEFISPFHPTR